MDYNPSSFFVPGILQARIPEWVAISFFRDLPDPGIEPESPALQVDSLPNWVTREAKESNYWDFNPWQLKDFHIYVPENELTCLQYALLVTNSLVSHIHIFSPGIYLSRIKTVTVLTI